eukprot:GHVL01011561.1.p1 GENE.GHVL01011561.1~~GHVL01011561.1.p1  ORF type:complete len:294 (-),score=68.21 GHVL01011561.1:286-1167(-)
MALELNENNETALYIKGICLFLSGNAKEAKTFFLKSEKLTSAEPIKRWLRKCDAEIENHVFDIRDNQQNVGLNVQNAGSKIQNAGSDQQNAGSDQQNAGSDQQNAGSPKYDWTQIGDELRITVHVTDITEDQVTTELQQRSVLIKINSKIVEINDLFDNIRTDYSTKNISSNSVIIQLKKENQNIYWPSLQRASGMLKKPQSAYSTKKDWNVIDHEIEEEMKSDKPEGEAALNNLFKEIYSKSDPDTRRAMIKSFQTSGGTVLSTNWKEVSDQDYDKTIQAPEGLQVKRWNEN